MQTVEAISKQGLHEARAEDNLNFRDAVTSESGLYNLCKAHCENRIFCSWSKGIIVHYNMPYNMCYR
jgi:hypothetical protein